MTARKLGIIVLVNTLGGVIPALFLDGPRGVVFLSALVFSYCIGSLIFAVMHFAHPVYNRFPPVWQWTAEIATFLALAVIGSMVAMGILVGTGILRMEQFRFVLVNILWVVVIFSVVFGAAVSFVLAQSGRLRQATLELRTRQLEEERARKLASEARLSSLESRVHPHFLFNTLNSIAALIREDPARAEQTVERLAALLRYSLDASTSSLVPLRQELRVVQDYLDIEKTRLGDRLRFSVDAPPDMEDVQVPPLSLQTLVENSIKHAISPDRKGGEIRISARLERDFAVLEVSDDGPGFDPASVPQGHGLDNLRDRLAVLFDGSGHMHIARSGGRTVVWLMVPQKQKVPAG